MDGEKETGNEDRGEQYVQKGSKMRGDKNRKC